MRRGRGTDWRHDVANAAASLGRRRRCRGHLRSLLRRDRTPRPARSPRSCRWRRRRSRPRRSRRRRRRSRRGATRRWPSGRGSCSGSASCSTPAPASSPRSSPRSTARCSPTPRGEVARGQEVVEFACGIAAPAEGRLRRRTPRPTSTCTRCASRSASSAIISPFNFPAMVPMWFFPLAIAAGNTVVLKPIGEGADGGAVDRGAVGGRGPARRRVQRRSTATRSPSTRC